jgi:hypothetical protein
MLHRRDEIRNKPKVDREAIWAQFFSPPSGHKEKKREEETPWFPSQSLAALSARHF